MKHNMVVILDNIRSKQNVGSVFRTSDALGVSHVYLIGTTPTPVDRFNRPVGEIAKTALGAECVVPWTYAKTLAPIIRRLKSSGYTIVALEQDSQSIDYKKFKPESDIALILGNEVEGVGKSTLKQSDVIVEIPMQGSKESLNVSVAYGVAGFRILGR